MALSAKTKDHLRRTLKCARTSNGMSVQWVAKCLQLEPEILKGVEEGQWLLTSAELQLICRVYGLDRRTVFGQRASF